MLADVAELAAGIGPDDRAALRQAARDGGDGGRALLLAQLVAVAVLGRDLQLDLADLVELLDVAMESLPAEAGDARAAS